MRKHPIIKCLAGLAGLFIFLFLFVALLLPVVVDSQVAKETIRAFLLDKTHGSVTIDKIDLAWLPRPVVVIQGASLSVVGTGGGTIRSIKVYPSIAGLFRGRLIVSRAVVDSPAVTMRFVGPAGGSLDVDEIEGKIRAALATLASEIPGIAVDVVGGSADIRIGDKPSLVIRDLEARVLAQADEIDLRVTSRSNAFDWFRFEVRIAGENLATKGRVAIQHLRLREAVVSLFPDLLQRIIQDGDVNLHLRLTSAGLKKVKVEIDGSLPSLALVRESGENGHQGKRVQGIHGAR
ncbi:MAG: hypothetical protein HY695_00570 [Deltaproteobacteria bacterium]|nr:hypothetical protein [Deltaproteobacteria bacterium]